MALWRVKLPLDRTPARHDRGPSCRSRGEFGARHLLIARLDAIHWIRADLAEERLPLTAVGLRCRLFGTLAPVFAWRDGLNTADKPENYRDAVDGLHLVQAHPPTNGG